jgi:hypothetical protein
MYKECVYVLLDSRKSGVFSYEDLIFNNEPFYVGKGSPERPYKHLKAVKYNWSSPAYFHNIHKTNKIRKMLREGSEPIVYIYKNDLSAEESIELEKEVIKKIGRKDKKLGPLTNKTDGGDGPLGVSITDELRKKLSENHADFNGEKNPFFGKKHREETKKRLTEIRLTMYKGINNPMYGVHRFGASSPHYGCRHTEISKKLMSEKKIGKRCSEKIKLKISEAQKIINKRPEYKQRKSDRSKGENNNNARSYTCFNLISKEIKKYDLRAGLENFCYEKGFPLSTILKSLNEKKEYKGWIFESVRKKLEKNE